MPTKTKPDSFHRRVKVTSRLFALAFLIVLARSLYLQTKEHGKLERLSNIQSLRSVTIKGPRGPILDCNGEYLALSVKSYSIYAMASKIKDKWDVSRKLSGILGENPRLIYRRLKGKRRFVWIKRRVPRSVVKRIKKLGIRGIGVISEYKRVYPKGKLFRCIIGSVGSELQGLSGLELAYNDILREKVVRKTGVIRDARGNLISLNPSPSVPLEKGIKLTLDARVGIICEEELERGIGKFRAKSGMAVVMDPENGAVIAMVSVPPCRNPRVGRNPVYANLIEPGSTLKPFILARALEDGIIERGTIINCGDGSLRVSGHTIHDAHPYQELTAEDVVVKSSNVGISRIALMEGKKRVRSLLESLNFARGTGIDVVGEERGMLGSFRSDIDVACKAFGQGISVTFLSLVNAFSIFANGGMLPRPYIVSYIVDENGKPIRRMGFPSMKRVISEDVANTMRIVLRKVVVVGTGKKAEIEGFNVCGKTGTSQKLGKNGTYSKNRFYSIFIGFFPMENPKLLIGVLVDEPKRGHYGGDVAAPIFRKIGERLIAYYGMTPPGPIKKDITQPITKSQEKREPKIQKRGTMPDVRGCVLRRALRHINPLGVPVRVVGRGPFVVSQEPPPGTPGKRIKEVIIRLGEGIK